MGLGVAVDAARNIVVTGGFQGTVDLGGSTLTSAGLGDMFVAKFEESGNHLWSKRFGDPETQTGWHAAVDGSGNIFLAGNFLNQIDFGCMTVSSAGGSDIFLAKLNPAGNCLWALAVGSAAMEFTSTMSTSDAGTTVLALQFAGMMTFNGMPISSLGGMDIFAAKFGSNGIYTFNKHFGDLGMDRPTGIEMDDAGGTVIIGTFDNKINFGGNTLTSAGMNDIFVAKFDSAGNHVFSKSYGDAADQTVSALAVDDNGNIVIAGSFQGTVDFGGNPMTSTGTSDLFLARLNAIGGHLFSKHFVHSGSGSLLRAAVDANGNIVLGGGFSDSFDVGGGSLVSAGGTDLFIAKFDTSGKHMWSGRFGGTQDEATGDVAVDGLGDVVLTGSFMGTIDFGGGPLMSAGGTDIFLAKLRLP
jgi:hypothetical protein